MLPILHVLKPSKTCHHTSQLEINVSKTKELSFGTKQGLKTETVSLDDQRIEAVENFKKILVQLFIPM